MRIKTFTRFQLDVLRGAREALEHSAAFLIERSEDPPLDELIDLEKRGLICAMTSSVGWAVTFPSTTYRIVGWKNKETT